MVPPEEFDFALFALNLKAAYTKQAVSNLCNSSACKPDMSQKAAQASSCKSPDSSRGQANQALRTCQSI